MTKSEYDRLVSLLRKGTEAQTDAENQEMFGLLENYGNSERERKTEEEANKLSGQLKSLNKKDREALISNKIKKLEKDTSKVRIKEMDNLLFPSSGGGIARGYIGRNLIEATTGSQALKEIPGYEKMSESELTDALRSKAYKKLPEFRRSVDFGNETIIDPNLEPIASSVDEGIKVRPFDKGNLRSTEAGNILHELQHQFDQALYRKNNLESQYKDKVYENSKFSGLKKILGKASPKEVMSKKKPLIVRDTSAPEFDINKEGPVIDERERRLQDMEAAYPNRKIQKYSQDEKAIKDLYTEFNPTYKYPDEGLHFDYLNKGLNTTGDPLQDQKDLGRGHFIEPSGTEKSRALENLHNTTEGGLDKFVKNDRFKKIRGLLA
jgi:hypothetical protein